MPTIDSSIPSSPGNPSLNPKDTLAPTGATGVVTLNPGDKITNGVQNYRIGTGPIYQNSLFQPSGNTSASTTTVSNANKINQVPGIVNSTNQFAQTGISTDANGVAKYSNGTLVPVPQEGELPPTPTDKLGTPGISQGGYFGDRYIAPGDVLPTGPDGKPVTLTPTSPTDDQILQSINNLKATSDSITASFIDSIHQQYAQLRQQQQEANRRSEKSVKTALLTGGVTGKGSASQYAPISSEGIIQSQVSYGLGQIADLNAKEQAAILQAQQAGFERDYKLMDSLNQQISKIRDEKVKKADEVAKTIADQNAKLREKILQSSRDSAITNVFNQGVLEPSEILDTLNYDDNGKKIGDFTLAEVSTAVKNLRPDAEDINAIMVEASKFGADPETLNNIKNAKSLGEALKSAGGFMSAEYKQKLAQQDFENKLSLQQLNISRANLALSQRRLELDEAEKNGMGDLATLTAYAQQYASTGQIPTGMPKGTFGLVSEIAKDLPKSNGTLVDKNTGIKPTGNDTKINGLGDLYSTIELAKQLKELDTKRPRGITGGLMNLAGESDSKRYLDLRTQITDLLARARTGAAINANEERLYAGMLPGRYSNPLGLGSNTQSNIDNFINNLSSDLSNKLNTQGWSMYGMSKVKLPDGKDYKVGDIISNGQQQARVNPDGSLSLVE